jgi:hypothetical protein
MNDYLIDVPGRSRARPLIQGACDALTFESHAPVLSVEGQWAFHAQRRGALSAVTRDPSVQSPSLASARVPARSRP